jgi:two-component system LytT family response regulator
MQENQVRILMVDDEEEAISALKGLLKGIPEATIVAEASSATEALKKLDTARPDLALVDVKLPDGNGFDLVVEIRRRQPNCGIVFVTAFDHYAMQALKLSALDYLLKPVAQSDLRDVIHRYIHHKAGADIHTKLEKLQQFLHEGKKVKFNHRDGFILLDPQEIIVIQASGSYSELKLTSGRSEIVSMNLGLLEEILGLYGFFRISRSDIINIGYLSKVNRKMRECVLQAGTTELTLHISVDRINKLEDRLLM